MIYIETIQQVIDLLEENGYAPIDIAQIERRFGLSKSNLYRLFFSYTGYSVKEYIRYRKMTVAAKQLKEGKLRILDIAMNAGYHSEAGFSRYFTSVTGFLPKEYRTVPFEFYFERIDLMKKYEMEHAEERFLDIRVVKHLEASKIAEAKSFGLHPEKQAFTAIRTFIDSYGIENYQIFGNDIPCSRNGQKEYGYRVFVTLPESFDQIPPEHIELGTFGGGMFAVASTKIASITSTRKRMLEWLLTSKFEIRNEVYLEAYEDDSYFQKADIRKQKIDFLLPIKKRELQSFVFIPPTSVAYYRESGMEAEQTAHSVWGTMLEWIRKNKLNPAEHKLYMFNHGFSKKSGFWYELMVTLPENAYFEHEKVQKKEFSGGYYLVKRSSLERLKADWADLGRMKELLKLKYAKEQWLENWQLSDWTLPEKVIDLYLPITEMDYRRFLSEKSELEETMRENRTSC